MKSKIHVVLLAFEIVEKPFFLLYLKITPKYTSIYKICERSEQSKGPVVDLKAVGYWRTVYHPTLRGTQKYHPAPRGRVLTCPNYPSNKSRASLKWKFKFWWLLKKCDDQFSLLARASVCYYQVRKSIARSKISQYFSYHRAIKWF